MKAMFYLLAIVPLAGCGTTPAPSVVTQVVPQRNISVPPVTPPAPFKAIRFKFQRPEAPNGVVAMDVENYSQFREFMLGLNKRELEWGTKLEQANRSILLLQGAKEPVTTEIPTQ